MVPSIVRASSPSSFPSTSSSAARKPRSSAKRETSTRKRRIQDDQVLMMSCETQRDTPNRDRFDSFGQIVSQTLRQMPGRQYLYAQKLMSDILFAGELGTLSEKSHFVAEPQESCQTPSPRSHHMSYKQEQPYHQAEVYSDYDQ